MGRRNFDEAQGRLQPKGETMPKFVTIGYGDRAGYDCIAPDIRDAVHAADENLK